MSKAVFYHAGCPVCVSAEQTVADSLKGDVEKVHLGEQSGRVAASSPFRLLSLTGCRFTSTTVRTCRL